MSLYHGIVMIRDLWYRLITTITTSPSGERKLNEFDNGPYRYALLEHFFPNGYRVEVRKINVKKNGFRASASPTTDPLEEEEALRYSNASDQFRVFIKGHKGWLKAFEAVGFLIGNSKKMAKRLTEIVRATSMWSFRSVDSPLRIDVIDHKSLGLQDSDVDGISAISMNLACECVNNNTYAGRSWRRRMIRKIQNGEIAVLSLRIITPNGLVKGNAIIIHDDQMDGYDVRTFALNFKPELASNGWYWTTLDTTYGINPTKSDDMSTAIFHNVEGMYDKETLMGSLKSYLALTFEELKAGKMTEEMTRIADGESNILHDEQEKRFTKGRGRAARIQLAVAEMAGAGVAITASQTLMFLFVNGLRNQFFSTKKRWNNDTHREELMYPEGYTWMDKDRHWFPVPYAFTTHIMTREALECFGFQMPQHQDAFVHHETHCFVVTGEYFALHYANHGGFDLDDGIKVHVRRVQMGDGSVELMAVLLRDPMDFGEWSMTTIHPSVIDSAYHRYTDEAPLVNYVDLVTKVPQFTTLRNQIHIGTLPYVTNPTQISAQYNLADEERVRQLSQAFPAGTGGTVTPKMLWYALLGTYMTAVPGENEALIDVLQQGLGTQDDVEVIATWAKSVFKKLGELLSWEMDPFWYHTRLPAVYREENDGPWTAGDVADSWWVQFHLERERVVSDYLKSMRKWLNSQIVMPEALASINWTSEELEQVESYLNGINEDWESNKSTWSERFVAKLSNSDKSNGEEVTDRRILLCAWGSFMRKQRNSYKNHDQWLYSIDNVEQLPYEWFVRAMTRIQDGTYHWSTPEHRFMDEELVNEIRTEFIRARACVDANNKPLLAEDRQENLIRIMRGHILGNRPKTVDWGNAALAALKQIKS